MTNQDHVLALCSEFSDEYGFDSKDKRTLVVCVKKEYINELKNMLGVKNYKLKKFQVYGDEAIVYFIPSKK
jgi:hypothetical protein